MGFLKPQLKSRRQRILVIFIPCILLGLVLLVSGAGKLPGQAEFVDVLLGSFWAPPVAFFISHVLPWIEVVLGAVLLLGVFPRIAAALSLPLLAGFMANNAWAISQGEQFGQCGCFGIFEELFGDMTPVQALGMDIALLFLALTIIILHPAPFLSFQSWFAKRKGEQNT
jgi:putative oxidoreductase